jgi:hypothetical protein
MLTDDAYIPPATEQARLRAVEQVSVMGTAQDERFDQIIRVAKMMFNVPMSSISVLDDRHQWFKSVDGMAEAPIPRDETVCQVTIARAYREPDDSVFVVEDATSVADFACLPGIGGDDGVRFYAGHPLYGPGGHPVGVFCIYDTTPRTLDAGELAAFAELAGWVQNEIERSADLERAAAVQRELLPREIGDLPGYDIGAMCLPAFSVGGDFYDHYVTDKGAYFSLIDVMGKGMAAAILTASVRSTLRGSTRALEPVPNTGLDTVLSVVSEQLSDDFTRTGSFATAFHCRLDPTTHTLTYVDAGHGLSFLCRPDGSTIQLAAPNLPLGVGAEWTSAEVTFEPGDMLVICSDGLLDIVSKDSNSSVLSAFLDRHDSPEDVAGAVQELVRTTIPLDDVTLIAIRREPA